MGLPGIVTVPPLGPVGSGRLHCTEEESWGTARCQVRWRGEGTCGEKAEGTRELVYHGQDLLDSG